MNHPGLLWRHFVLTVHHAWHHGDPRGFRSRDHRIHSSGDYRQPPPADEHAALHRYRTADSEPPRPLPIALRSRIGLALLERLRSEGCPVLALAVAAMHVHGLAEMPADPDQAMALLGRCKGYASHRVRADLPGRIWGQGAGLQPIRDERHRLNTLRYIREEQGDNAWVWCAEDGGRREGDENGGGSGGGSRA